MKKIAILTSSLAMGGAERAASLLVELLLRSALYDVSVILFERRIDFKINCSIIVIDAPAYGNPLMRIINFFKRIYYLTKTIHNNNFDVIISFLEGPNLLLLLAPVCVKKIISVHSAKISSLRDKGIMSVIRHIIAFLLYSRANKVVVVSQKLHETLLKWPCMNGSKISLIQNSVDINKIIIKSKHNPQIQEIIFTESIVTMGRLSKPKGHWHLLYAFTHFKKIYPNASLIIIGDGDMRDDLVKLSKLLGFKTYAVWEEGEVASHKDVYFVGALDNPFQYIARSTFFVLSSLWEGFPTAVIEAMACGAPIIATDCISGPREILTATSNAFFCQNSKIELAEYGILVPVCKGPPFRRIMECTSTELLLGQAMVELMNSKDIQMKYRRASRLRINNFSTEKISKKWLTLLDEILC